MISHPGSSPHTRETPPCQRDQGCFCRFIPACAGNARARFTKARSWPVHPRIRGERRFIGSTALLCGGSSPHTRGTSVLVPADVDRERFIPAYAGNESLISARASCTTVHPRIRGERIQRSLAGLGFGGSSPHTRGTTDAAPVARPAGRFIPAYAGNEQTVRVARLTWPVHPRIRGERSQRAPRTLATSGSSPHTRGTIPAPPPPSTRSRFIPAYAGNAPAWSPRSTGFPVHPRIRGERFTEMGCFTPRSGSSPHTRGTHFQ